jgi:hypothetical protein
MMRKTLLVATALFATSLSSVGKAQGALSLQGLGFPPGQISARAEGTGGGVADFDALSVTNPASLAGVGAAALFLQYSPEWRRVTTSSELPTPLRLASIVEGVRCRTIMDVRTQLFVSPGSFFGDQSRPNANCWRSSRGYGHTRRAEQGARSDQRRETRVGVVE